MLGNIKSFVGLARLQYKTYAKYSLMKFDHTSKTLHTSVFNASATKARDRKELTRSVKTPSQGTDGEFTQELGSVIKTKNMFVDMNTPNTLFDGVPFSQTPILNVKCSKNNTILLLSDYTGKPIAIHSCGKEGFKNCRKGTNVAAQSTALTISAKSVKMGVKNVRLKVQGLGPGRMACVKGILMGGLNVISVTDDTRISYNPPRPRKRRRV